MTSSFITPVTSFEVVTPKGHKLINPAKVLFIKGYEKKYTLIYLTDSPDPAEAHHLLKWYDNKLLEPDFCRCHDSIIVNCHYIECTAGNKFILRNNTIIDISRNKKDHASECYERVIMENQENFKNKEFSFFIAQPVINSKNMS